MVEAAYKNRSGYAVRPPVAPSDVRADVGSAAKSGGSWQIRETQMAFRVRAAAPFSDEPLKTQMDLGASFSDDLNRPHSPLFGCAQRVDQ